VLSAAPTRSTGPVNALYGIMETMSALSFFLAWLANPRRVGAIVPSSAALADAMTVDLWPSSAPVIELGPGTGVVTRSIIARGISEDRLALIEYDGTFVDRLQRDFPRAHVHQMDATRLRHIELFDGERAGAVVSGIPLLLMPAKNVLALLDGVFEQLRPDGAFYQFTYGRDAPIARPLLDRLSLRATRIGGTLANVPPAVVYRICRRSSRTRQTHWAGNQDLPTPANEPVFAARSDFERVLPSRIEPLGRRT
jgi:phosphatidylethanolamine/phosphatidyl-N-methylethanolamine N-methyltransferase